MLPSPQVQTIDPVPERKSKKVKSVYNRMTLIKTVTKGARVSKKRKTVTEDPMLTEDLIQTEELVNVNEEAYEYLVVSDDLFRKKKVKLPTPPNQK